MKNNWFDDFKIRSVFLSLIIGFFVVNQCFSQNHYQRYSSIDVLHYKFEVELNDTSNYIKGNSKISIAFKKDLKSFTLDFKCLNEKGLGMVIDRLSREDRIVKYTHNNDQIEIFDSSAKKGQELTYEVAYHGIPENGLIIAENLFGDRVFFADHWPNRAHYWLPTVDHPSDKSTVEFIVKAPSHYQVVANGKQIEETNSGENTITHWKTDIPLPTKVMVIGVAQFATQYYVGPNNISMSTWVYPQNRDEGFLDYKHAIKPMEYYSSLIAPYPYSKLANVQAKTMFGGMENAGCIFYFEKSVTGKQDYELLFAHEIAHQWFGNSVSELNWHHIWLSEGFATYLTALYVENEYGRESFESWVVRTRRELIAKAKDNYFPIIDTSMSISVELLNDNTYDKAAMFLHMLRKELSDAVFWKSLSTFYERFKNKNALTEDYLEVVEELSGKEFDEFFNQWLYQSGHPKLKCSWEYKNNNINLKVIQKQNNEFRFPLEIEIVFDDGSSLRETLNVNSKQETFKIESSKAPKKIIYDPDAWLLFEFID